jgi:hypothetical protein
VSKHATLSKGEKMAKHIEDEVAYYYDFHPTEEDLMGETSVHAALIHYLMDVLTWLFRGQACAIQGHLRLTQAQDEARRAEDEAEARRAETRRAEILAEKLRSLGIDPDKL